MKEELDTPITRIEKKEEKRAQKKLEKKRAKAKKAGKMVPDLDYLNPPDSVILYIDKEKNGRKVSTPRIVPTSLLLKS